MGERLVSKSRVIHDVERDSNLDLILRGTNGAVNKLADAIERGIGGGLRAIAVALSTPQDNSAQVQAEIDRYVAQLNAGTDEVQNAINEQQKGAK